MIIKATALSLILLVCTLSGFYKTYSLKKRVKELEGLSRYLEKLMLEIRFSMKSIPAILDKIGIQALPLLNEILHIDKNNSMYDIYYTAKQTTKNQMFLNNDDWVVLDVFFPALGGSDLDGQISLCKNTLILLEKQIKQAEAVSNKYSKMYSSTGFLIGLFIVIIFL
ncbi:MAG: stage sporulation protein SpoAB [Clostridia bacterium]|nr:stage sporulation protein SpoAB [Clostridia bacterium]